MIVSVHQPHYFPWTGYIDKIDSADVFVVLDTVQFEKNGWQNRNRIKTSGGWTWLTVPVLHHFGERVVDVGLDIRTPWERKHRAALATWYGKAVYYREYAPYMDEFYSRKWERLCPLADENLRFFLDAFGVSTPVVKASELGAFPDEPNERLAEIVRRLGGDTYLAGGGFAGYYRPEPFEKANIRVVEQKYEPQEYTQLFGPFIPGLSSIDLLFNCGNESLAVIRRGRRTIL